MVVRCDRHLHGRPLDPCLPVVVGRLRLRRGLAGFLSLVDYLLLVADYLHEAVFYPRAGACCRGLHRRRRHLV